MSEGQTLRLCLRSQQLTEDVGGHTIWRPVTTEMTLPASEVAILICDMWDVHWSRGAMERVEGMVPRFNRFIRAARAKGVHIIHAPSDTLDFYTGHPARQRALQVPHVAPPAEADHFDPPLPIDASDHGSDTGETEPRQPWSRQHPAIEIDREQDVISDDGREVYSFLQAWDVKYLLIAGVHTNMCVLNRSFGIKQMVKWGVPVALVRDLTDAMYNPAMSPYVSHDEGTRLVVEYIEKFWCPTVLSADIVSVPGAP